MFEKLDKVYCYPDALQNRYLPQAWQIFIMKNFLENHKKKLISILEKITRAIKNENFLEKIQSNPNIHGFIFFTITILL